LTVEYSVGIKIHCIIQYLKLTLNEIIKVNITSIIEYSGFNKYLYHKVPCLHYSMGI
jgi:hypothetical protein